MLDFSDIYGIFDKRSPFSYGMVPRILRWSHNYQETKEDMKLPQKRSKTKKKTAIASAGEIDIGTLEKMARNARYRPSPYHKFNPGACGLTEPPKPRPDKTICEGAGITCGREAAELLKSGFRCGMVSEQKHGKWPRNVWVVDAEGYIYEAQLSNPGLGEYHGYPMKEGDRFAEYVRTEWERRSQ